MPGNSEFFLLCIILPHIWEEKIGKISGSDRHKRKSYRVKNFKFSSENAEIQNLPLIHLPIYKSIFFFELKNPKIKIFPKNAWFLKGCIFGFFTLKKKFTYILVNGLMANFEFQSFWVIKVDFFCHGAPILPRSVLKFFWRASNLLKAKI